MSDIHWLLALREDAGGDKGETKTLMLCKKKWEITHDKGASGSRRQTQETKSDSGAAQSGAAASFSLPPASLLSVCLCVSPRRSIISSERSASGNRAKHCQLNCEVRSAAVCNVSRAPRLSAERPDGTLRTSRGRLQMKTLV